jgi:hypothetical protein
MARIYRFPYARARIGVITEMRAMRRHAGQGLDGVSAVVHAGTPRRNRHPHSGRGGERHPSKQPKPFPAFTENAKPQEELLPMTDNQAQHLRKDTRHGS